MGVLLLGDGEFLSDGLDFVLELLVGEGKLMFFICDEGLFDFDLFDDVEVLIFEDEKFVFEGHVFIEYGSVLFSK